MRRLLILLMFFSFSCVEPYEFIIEAEEPSLVVEGSISNVSFNESLMYPSDGRFFSVKLGYTSDVINRRGSVASNATVLLEDNTGQQWAYTESAAEPGKYELLWEEFEAVEGKAYKLKIFLPNEEIYESEWETILPPAPGLVGKMGFTEVEKQVYRIKLKEKVVVTIRGIEVYIDVPETSTEAPVYYRWDFQPTWVYIAPLGRSSRPDYKCWATSKYYLPDFVVQKDVTGGYRKKLFFLEVDGNERIYEKLSVLVVQQSLSEENYYFWKEMKEQVESGGLFTSPPFNLRTNLKAVNSKRKVFGYFGLINEQATRWYFSKEELSYHVDNTLIADCQSFYSPGNDVDYCVSCLEYTKGKATNVEPVWWGQY